MRCITVRRQRAELAEEQVRSKLWNFVSLPEWRTAAPGAQHVDSLQVDGDGDEDGTKNAALDSETYTMVLIN